MAYNSLTTDPTEELDEQSRPGIPIWVWCGDPIVASREHSGVTVHKPRFLRSFRCCGDFLQHMSPFTLRKAQLVNQMFFRKPFAGPRELDSVNKSLVPAAVVSILISASQPILRHPLIIGTSSARMMPSSPGTCILSVLSHLLLANLSRLSAAFMHGDCCTRTTTNVLSNRVMMRTTQTSISCVCGITQSVENLLKQKWLR